VSKHSSVKVTQTKLDDPFEFTVTLKGSGGETHHEVTMTQSTYEKLTGSQVSPESCVHAAFEFLLEREPQESILTSFDITVISTYYPAFETEFSGYLHLPPTVSVCPQRLESRFMQMTVGCNHSSILG
jgi:hypothetical protein